MEADKSLSGKDEIHLFEKFLGDQGFQISDLTDSIEKDQELKDWQEKSEELQKKEVKMVLHIRKTSTTAFYFKNHDDLLYILHGAMLFVNSGMATFTLLQSLYWEIVGDVVEHKMPPDFLARCPAMGCQKSLAGTRRKFYSSTVEKLKRKNIKVGDFVTVDGETMQAVSEAKARELGYIK
jgi:hypothetical protein